MKNTLKVLSVVMISVVVTILGAFSSRAADAMQGAQDAVVLNPEIQQEITRILDLIMSGTKTKEDVMKLIDDFKTFNGKSSAEVLLQVLAIYGGKDEARTNPQVEVSKRIMMGRLLQDMPPEDIIGAVAPAYERAADLKVKKSLRYALDMAAFRGGNVDPDFTAFTAYVEKEKQQPPQSLVIYMYQLKPEKALREMRKVFSAGGSEGAEPPSTEVESLKAMAATGSWWESLYVAEQVRRNPGLRDPQLVQQLKGDPSKIVRDVSADLDKKP